MSSTTGGVLHDAGPLGRVDGCDVVVMSKTVESTNIGDRLRLTTQQMVHMMATIDNDERRLHPSRRPGLAARGPLGRAPHLHLARRDHLGSPGRPDRRRHRRRRVRRGRGHPAIYVVERGARLSDGINASGRRAFFGLYDDTFRLLTSDGRALFDAIVRWAVD